MYASQTITAAAKANGWDAGSQEVLNGNLIRQTFTKANQSVTVWQYVTVWYSVTGTATKGNVFTRTATGGTRTQRFQRKNLAFNVANYLANN